MHIGFKNAEVLSLKDCQNAGLVIYFLSVFLYQSSSGNKRLIGPKMQKKEKIYICVCVYVCVYSRAYTFRIKQTIFIFFYGYFQFYCI